MDKLLINIDKLKEENIDLKNKYHTLRNEYEMKFAIEKENCEKKIKE